jgi:hypothetical protein
VLSKFFGAQEGGINRRREKIARGTSWCKTDGACGTCGEEHKCLQGFGEEA